MLDYMLEVLSKAVDVLGRRIGNRAVQDGFDHHALGIDVVVALDGVTGASLDLRSYQRERQFEHNAAVRSGLAALLDGHDLGQTAADGRLRLTPPSLATPT